MEEKIEPNSVVNKENLELLICEICKGIFIEPIQCSICRKIFCKKCIENLQKNNREKNCINNCTKPEFNSPKNIIELLKKLKLICKNGCKEEIFYSDLEEHYKNKCPKKIIDYKSEYLEYKNKYEELLRKYEELEKNRHEELPIQNENNEENNINANNNDINENVELIFKSRYHAHDLKYKSLYYEDWECCECLNSFEKKTKTGYNCSECGFNICSKCKALEKSGYIINDAIGTLHHKHILRENIINKDYICDICKKCFNGLKTTSTYGCHEKKCNCNFDICIECLKKETPEIK
jgi:hypothetical protein